MSDLRDRAARGAVTLAHSYSLALVTSMQFFIHHRIYLCPPFCPNLRIFSNLHCFGCGAAILELGHFKLHKI
jgi:hypothetical protein